MTATIELDLDSFPVHDTTWWVGWFPKDRGGCYFWIDSDGGKFRHFEVAERLDWDSLSLSFQEAIDRDDETADYGRPAKLICTHQTLSRLLEPLASDSFEVSFKPHIPFLSEMFGRMTEMAAGRNVIPPIFPGLEDSELGTELIQESVKLYQADPWKDCKSWELLRLQSPQGPLLGSFRVDSFGPCLIVVKGEESAQLTFAHGEFCPGAVALSFLPSNQARVGVQERARELGLDTPCLFEVTPLLPELPDYQTLLDAIKTINVQLERGLKRESCEPRPGWTLEWPVAFEVTPAGLARQASWQLDPEVRAAAAKKALELDSNCVPAYHLLAAGASKEEEPEFRRKAVQAMVAGVYGEMSPPQLADWLLDFHALLDSLKAADRNHELAGVCEEYLDHAPSSPIGPAATLVLHHLHQGEPEKAKETLGKVDVCFWTRACRAVSAFLRSGDTAASRRLRAESVLENPQLVLYVNWPHYAGTGEPEYQEAKSFAQLLLKMFGVDHPLRKWLSDGKVDVVSDPGWLRELGAPEKPVSTTVRRDRPKIGRNDPCWCGSGKKYKKCHLKLEG